ncbi:MAG: hypothetical protein ACLFUW_00195 [Bacteroidales bacterium]
MKNRILENSSEQESEKPSKIEFLIDEKPLITFCEKGIFIHQENFPDLTLNDFARQFINLMQESYNIRFIPLNEND